MEKNRGDHHQLDVDPEWILVLLLNKKVWKSHSRRTQCIKCPTHWRKKVSWKFFWRLQCNNCTLHCAAHQQNICSTNKGNNTCWSAPSFRDMLSLFLCLNFSIFRHWLLELLWFAFYISIFKWPYHGYKHRKNCGTPIQYRSNFSALSFMSKISCLSEFCVFSVLSILHCYCFVLHCNVCIVVWRLA